MAGPEDYSLTAAQVAQANAMALLTAQNAGKATSNVAYNTDTGLSYNPNVAVQAPYNTANPSPVVSYNTATGLAYNANAAVAAPAAPSAPQGPTGPIAPTGPASPASPTGSTGSTGSVPYAPTGPTATQMADRQNIFDQLTSLFTTYGVIKAGDKASDALLKTMKDLAMSGAGSDTISLALQQSDAYKARFAGNELRRAAGLSVLSPAEYIATEKAYDQVLRAAGVPTTFYRGTDEMSKLIGADVSPTELQNRVDLAAKSISNADPFYTQQLQNFYGLSQGDMIAHVLDPAVAAPLIQKQVSTATIGAAAARNATNVDLSTAAQLAGMGISQAQAEQGFGNIAAQLPSMQAIASRYQGFGTASQVGQELQSATFNAPISGLTAAQSEQALKRLQTQEASAFGGSAGAGKGSLLGSEEGVQ
jgi:hypothetical protein